MKGVHRVTELEKCEQVKSGASGMLSFWLKRLTCNEGSSGSNLVRNAETVNSFIRSFIQAISIAPLRVHYYSEALPTQHGYCTCDPSDHSDERRRICQCATTPHRPFLCMKLDQVISGQLLCNDCALHSFIHCGHCIV